MNITTKSGATPKKLKAPKPMPHTAAEAEPVDVFTPTSLPNGETVSMSDFALGRHKPGTGYSYFEGQSEELLELVEENWDARKPGAGRKDLQEVVIVPVPADDFRTTTVKVDQETKLETDLYRRRDHEAPYLRTTAKGQAQEAEFAKVVLYSKETLAKNNERSSKADWEVVSVIASPVENEPMSPVTMMRNMRGLAGGSQVNYTAEELLESIEFWSAHTKLRPD